ncbi:DUF2157 domain-containing protein [Daejeonella oryzae]|uniref:DUF2157 domain-containing protein n=1 Tax=Daejeonella oryzae TaxID=1122943 RepID=UPI00042354F4|nr:DUF2157 domain-containing protein [Daejeonella oryzae]
MTKLNLDKEESEFLDSTIKKWESDGLLDTETASKLRSSYTVKGFDWRRLAQYSFWVALVCGIISIASLIIDDTVIKWLSQLYDTPDILISLISGGLAALLFYLGNKKKKKFPERVFSNEAVIFLGVLFTASCIAFLGKTFDTGAGHFSILFLLSVFVYGLLAHRFNSRLIWAFSLISLGSWFGTETGYQTDWSYYFLGMNYPLRFVLFGILLVAFSFIMQKINRLNYFREFTYIIGLMYLFISLWLLSIFGNFGTIEDWFKVKQIELFYWGIISTAIAAVATVYGLRKNDFIAREFGITFLLINIYTRYFEYLWDVTYKAIFFTILGLSFWLIGRKAEKIWNLEFLKKD